MIIQWSERDFMDILNMFFILIILLLSTLKFYPLLWKRRLLFSFIWVWHLVQHVIRNRIWFDRKARVVNRPAWWICFFFYDASSPDFISNVTKQESSRWLDRTGFHDQQLSNFLLAMVASALSSSLTGSFHVFTLVRASK